MARLATYRLDDPEGLSRWEMLAGRADVASVFSDTRTAAAVARIAGCDAHIHIADRDGDDRAGIISFSRKRGGLRLSVHPALCYYSPLLLAERPDDASTNAGTDDLSLLLGSLTESQPGIRLQLPPALPDVRPAAQAGGPPDSA